MKKLLYLIIILGMITVLAGCKKEEKLPTFDKEFSITCESKNDFSDDEENYGKMQDTTYVTLLFQKDGTYNKYKYNHEYAFFNDEKFEEYKDIVEEIKKEKNDYDEIIVNEENKTITTIETRIENKDKLTKKEKKKLYVTEALKILEESYSNCVFENITREEIEEISK